MLKDERITDNVITAWWRLRQLKGVGNIAANALLDKLLSRYGSVEALLDLSADDLIALGLNPKAACQWSFPSSNSQTSNNQNSTHSESADVKQIRQWRQTSGQGILLHGGELFPEALSSLRDAPSLLWYRGDLDALAAPMLAVVGSRATTPAVLDWTYECCALLAKAGITIVSGLALGADAAAHSGALQGGRTIAVMGTGVDRIYPSKHQALAREITKQGLLISEFAPGTEPQASHFPSRNRIISGLCSATLIVEATIQSGTMITARLAAQQGRDVFALPGAVHNPLARGPHQLIREGALLVETADDILHAMNLGFGAGTEQHLPLTSSTPEKIPTLVTCVDFVPTAIDVIAIRSGLHSAELGPELLQLELDGWLRRDLGGYVRLK
ncbi:MAG: DNA-processing protein DprA [Oleibacter sp.]|nr:DNA-processing protein DprA [Thalassolituus sp.]